MTTYEHSDTIELGYVARTIGRGWRFVAFFAVAGILTAAALIQWAPKKFTAAGTIVLKSSGGGGSGAASLLSQATGLSDVTAGLLGGKSPLETEVEILSSRAVLGKVVDSLFLQARLRGGTSIAAREAFSAFAAPGSFKPLRLTFTKAPGATAYTVEGAGASATMTPGTPLVVGPMRATFATGVALPPTFRIDLRDAEDAIKRVDDHLTVKKGKGEVVTVSYAGDDSLTAARVPNLILDTYFTRRRGIDRGVNQQRVEFLTAKLDTMGRDLAKAAAALRVQQEATGVFDPETSARVGLESNAQTRTKLTDVMVEQGALERLMAGIEAKTASPRQLAAYPTFLRSPTVNNIVGQLTDVETRRTMMLTTRTDSDPAVQALVRSRDSLEAQLVPYARTYAASLAKERTDLETVIHGVDADLARLPGAMERGGQLELRVADLAKMSTGLQVQLVEAKLAAIGEGGDVRPLDLAMPPKLPSFPNPPLVGGVGLVAGIFLGVFAALLAGVLGRWVRDPIEIERTAGVPALQFDPAVPLLLTHATSRTIVVSPIGPGITTNAVANRLAQTAASRSLSAAVLPLDGNAVNANASIAHLESRHDLVIVQIPSLNSDAAAAVLQPARPVLLVTEGHRVDRRGLTNAVQLLKRLDVPCAGVIMSSNGDLTAAVDERILTP